MYHLGSEMSRQGCRILRKRRLNWSQQCPPHPTRRPPPASTAPPPPETPAAAAQFFSKQGPAANLAEVAAAAGVSRATLYRYYPNREALLKALGAHALNELANRLHDARVE